MSFGVPLLLLSLIAVPVAVALLLFLDRYRARRATAWAPAALLPNMTTKPRQVHRHLPTALMLLGVALLLVGFARPRATYHVKAQEATLVLVLDVSGSMAATDAQPTRFAAAKTVIQRFIARAPKGYRVSLVTFSDHVAVSAAPTRNMAAVSAALARARTGPQGTALADAVAREGLGRRAPSAGGGRRPLGRRSDGRPRLAGAGRRGGAEGEGSRVDGPGRDAGRRRPAEAQGRVHGAHPGSGAAAVARDDRAWKRR
jgi:Ca-activated chloride channel homolog